MAKKKLEIKADTQIVKVLRKEAENRGRDLSAQSVHLIRMGLILVEFCGGRDGFSHVTKVLEECCLEREQKGRIR